MNVSEFIGRHPGQSHVFPSDQLWEELPLARPWLYDPTRETLQISHEKELILPSAEDILQAQGGIDKVSSRLEEVRRARRLQRAIIFACDEQVQSVPEITRYVQKLQLSTRGLDRTIRNAKERGFLEETEERVVYMQKDPDKSEIKVWPSLPGYKGYGSTRNRVSARV